MGLSLSGLVHCEEASNVSDPVQRLGTKPQEVVDVDFLLIDVLNDSLRGVACDIVVGELRDVVCPVKVATVRSEISGIVVGVHVRCLDVGCSRSCVLACFDRHPETQPLVRLLLKVCPVGFK